MADPDGIAEFALQIATDRQAGSTDLTGDCFGTIPAQFTGAAPRCWSSCAGFDQTIADRTIDVSSIEGDGGCCPERSFVYWVTYRNGADVIDVGEQWTFDLTDEGLALVDITFSDPISSRDEAVETLTTYLGHVRDGNWLEVAAMLDEGALSPDERPDLRRLGLTDYSRESVAAALGTWCADGCTTDVPAAADLVWDGLYGIGRPGDQIRVSWFEGQRSIVGLPIRITTSGSGVASTPFVQRGTADEICTAAGRATSGSHESFTGVTIHDETVDAGGRSIRWLVCGGDPASGWGITALTSSDDVNWQIAPLDLGTSMHAGDETTVVVRGDTATIDHRSRLGDTWASADSQDGGMSWTVISSPQS